MSEHIPIPSKGSSRSKSRSSSPSCSPGDALDSLIPPSVNGAQQAESDARRHFHLRDGEDEAVAVQELLRVHARASGSDDNCEMNAKDAIKLLVTEGVAETQGRAALIINSLIKSGVVTVKTKKGSSTYLVYKIKALAGPPDAPKPLLSSQQQCEYTLDILSVNPVEVARQLALLEHGLFRNVDIRELALNPSCRSKELQLWIEFSNRLSGWSAQCIMETCISGTGPEKAMKFFTTLASECLKIRVIGSMAGLALALGSHEIVRLKDLWRVVPRKVSKVAQEVVDLASPQSNFERMREMMQKLQPPSVPFFPVFLKDLTMIHVGNHDDEDREVLREPLVAQLELFQQSEYSFTPIPRLQRQIFSVAQLPDDMASNLSDQAMRELEASRAAPGASHQNMAVKKRVKNWVKKRSSSVSGTRRTQTQEEPGSMSTDSDSTPVGSPDSNSSELSALGQVTRSLRASDSHTFKSRRRRSVAAHSAKRAHTDTEMDEIEHDVGNGAVRRRRSNSTNSAPQEVEEPTDQLKRRRSNSSPITRGKLARGARSQLQRSVEPDPFNLWIDGVMAEAQQHLDREVLLSGDEKSSSVRAMRRLLKEVQRCKRDVTSNNESRRAALAVLESRGALDQDEEDDVIVPTLSFKFGFATDEAVTENDDLCSTGLPTVRDFFQGDWELE